MILVGAMVSLEGSKRGPKVKLFMYLKGVILGVLPEVVHFLVNVYKKTMNIAKEQLSQFYLFIFEGVFRVKTGIICPLLTSFCPLFDHLKPTV